MAKIKRAIQAMKRPVILRILRANEPTLRREPLTSDSRLDGLDRQPGGRGFRRHESRTRSPGGRVIYSSLPAASTAFVDAGVIIHHFEPSPLFGLASAKLFDRFSNTARIVKANSFSIPILIEPCPSAGFCHAGRSSFRTSFRFAACAHPQPRGIGGSDGNSESLGFSNAAPDIR
jgi:hypothetical protein